MISTSKKGSVFLGIGLLLISGLGFTGSLLMANMATRNGIDVNTSNAVRFFLATVLLWAWHTATGRSQKMMLRDRYAALALGVAVFLMGAGYLGATQYIPVSLAVLIFYTGPFFIIIISRFTENEPITTLRLTAICVAFIGLILIMGVKPTASLPIRGILLAFTAAIGMAAFVTGSSLTIRTASPQMVNLHSLFSGTLLFGLFLIVMGGPSGTIGLSGALKLVGSGLSIAVGYITFFSGLKIIGPVRASILLNAEPVYTIALAALLLGERLSYTQFMGAALVITGIILITCLPVTTT
ncbi:MAG: DMT family transporter [Desulfobacterales bacterium]|nr:DMT family transporter [Desulfobacterales bacterium]MDX2511296.1 DMT family transporter [Desulfobacterales bacterium]